MAKHFVGLDVGLKETAVCIVDDEGNVIKQTTVKTDPEDIALLLYDQPGLEYHRIGLEAGGLSNWLYMGLAKAGLPAIVIETRHAAAILKNNINKTDKNDARGIANMMRSAMFKPVHVKTEWSQQVRNLLKSRRLIHWQAVAIENHIRGILRGYGLKVGQLPSREHYDSRVRELIEGNEMLSAVVEPLLMLRSKMREEEKAMYKRIVALAKSDPVCRRLMTMPGIGPIVALTFKTTVDIPERFIDSGALGAHLGLTPRRYQSGDTDTSGRISKFGDETARAMLVEAANVLLAKSRKKSWLKTWGLALRKRKGHRKAVVAIARKMAVVLHQMWLTSTDFRWTREEPLQAAA